MARVFDGVRARELTTVVATHVAQRCTKRRASVRLLTVEFGIPGLTVRRCAGIRYVEGFDNQAQSGRATVDGVVSHAVVVVQAGEGLASRRLR